MAKGKILTHEVKHINIVRSSKDWPYPLRRVSDCENMIYYISVYRIMGRTPMIYDIHKKTHNRLKAIGVIFFIKQYILFFTVSQQQCKL